MRSPERSSGIGRREFVRSIGGAALTVATVGLPTIGCARRSQTLKIGYVSPQTGPLAAFGEADNYVLAGIREALKGGLTSLAPGGASHQVEIVVKDSQSNPNRAAEVASDLILTDQVNLIVVASTPETTNPVADQCELNGTPCISTVAPWQPWFFDRGGVADKGFNWTYHFFWGLEDVIAVFTNMWQSIPTNRRVGALFPNDADGNAYGQAFPGALKEKGFSLLDPGRYQNLTADFSAQIAAFKRDNVEIVTGVVIPPDFRTVWTQMRQQGFRPKIASVAKALLFPPAVEAIGPIAEGLTTEVWWTPSHPFSSSLNGSSANALATGYESASGRQWTQPLGFVHALFEVAADTLKRADDVNDRTSIRNALASTNLNTIVGPISFSGGPLNPVKNVAKTPLVGGQWVKGTSRMFDLVIVNNQTAPQIPAGGELKPIA